MRIPKTFAEELGLSAGAAVEVRLSEGGLVIEPAPVAPPGLDELLERVTQENLHGEVEFGAAQGVEDW